MGYKQKWTLKPFSLCNYQASLKGTVHKKIKFSHILCQCGAQKANFKWISCPLFSIKWTLTLRLSSSKNVKQASLKYYKSSSYDSWAKFHIFWSNVVVFFRGADRHLSGQIKAATQYQSKHNNNIHLWKSGKTSMFGWCFGIKTIKAGIKADQWW